METTSPAPHHLPGPGGPRERFFCLLAETIPEIVFTASPEGSCDYVNGRFTEYTGLPRERCLGFGWAEVLHPDDAARARERWSESAEEGKTYEIEYRLRGGDGEYRWFLGRAEALLDDDGRVARWCGTCTDIHDRKTASDRSLRLAAEAARLGYWDWDIAADSITWSDHLEQVTGASPSKFGGTFEGFLKLVHPDDRGRVGAAVRKALDDGGPYQEELRLANPDGTFR